ncbi:hypothetical protein, partial [Mycobacterium tuberculosis]
RRLTPAVRTELTGQHRRGNA